MPIGGALPEPLDVLGVLASRASCRDFRPDAVDDAVIVRVTEAARRAPTSSNLQAYSIVVVRDATARRSLAELAGGQAHVATAPVFLAFCADLWRLERACAHTSLPFAANTLEMGLVAVLDAGLAGMCASLAAESLGLGTVMIGGLRNQPLEVARLLRLPPRVFAVFGLCLGWPRSRGEPKRRLPANAVVHQEVYHRDEVEESLVAYDAAHASRHDRSWLVRVAREAAEPRRAGVRQSLLALGFEFA